MTERSKKNEVAHLMVAGEEKGGRERRTWKRIIEREWELEEGGECACGDGISL